MVSFTFFAFWPPPQGVSILPNLWPSEKGEFSVSNGFFRVRTSPFSDSLLTPRLYPPFFSGPLFLAAWSQVPTGGLVRCFFFSPPHFCLYHPSSQPPFPLFMLVPPLINSRSTVRERFWAACSFCFFPYFLVQLFSFATRRVPPTFMFHASAGHFLEPLVPGPPALPCYSRVQHLPFQIID